MISRTSPSRVEILMPAMAKVAAAMVAIANMMINPAVEVAGRPRLARKLPR
jgi:hypothetical protein